MALVLVTGMSAVGKSTVLVELSKRGHAVVDADEDGFIEETNIEGQRDPEPLLREGKVSDLFDSHPADCHLFFAATAANQGTFYRRFDAVVLLTAPLNVGWTGSLPGPPTGSAKASTSANESRGIPLRSSRFSDREPRTRSILDSH